MKLRDWLDRSRAKARLYLYILDSEEILRVGVRLRHSDLKYEQKHQIILPQKHYITDLIIREAHVSLLHVGPQATLYHIRQRFWPVHAKNRIKQIIHQCIVCFKAKPKMFEHTQGDLLSDRFRPTRPFANSGVDYYGPFWVKEKKCEIETNRRSMYLYLFVCQLEQYI